MKHCLPKLARHESELIDYIDLDQHLPYRVAVLSNTMRQGTTDRYIRNTGMSPREWRVLSLIGLKGPLTPAVIAKMTGMDRATVTRAIAKLISLEYTLKEPHPTDGRSAWIRLTEAGSQKCQQIIPQMQANGADYLAVLSVGERQLFLELIDKLQLQAERVLSEGNS